MKKYKLTEKSPTKKDGGIEKSEEKGLLLIVNPDKLDQCRQLISKLHPDKNVSVITLPQ